MTKLARIRRLALLVAAAGAATLLYTCKNFTAATPKGFVELEDQTLYDYRATNPDGLVIGVRELPNEPEGELDFWARAIENQLRTRRGYALLEAREVTSKDGVTGRQFRFGHDESSAPHLYYLTVFVTPSTIQLIEVGGTRDLVTKHAAEVDYAVTNFEVD